MNLGKNDTKIIDKEFCEKQLEYIGHRPQGIKTGFSEIDYLMGGFKQGSTYLLAARPAMGKTAFALNLARNMAVKGNVKVAFFSPGETKEELVNKLLSMEAMVDSRNIRNNDLNEEELKKITEAAGRIGNGNLIINDTSGMDMETLKSELAKDIFNDVQVVFIDYMQLILGTTDAKGMVKERCLICRELQQIAKEKNVAMVVLSEVSKTVLVREDHRPHIDDLYVEEIANYFDNVTFLHRDVYYDKKVKDKNRAEIITEKDKNGRVGVVYLKFYPKYQLYTNAGVELDEE